MSDVTIRRSNLATTTVVPDLDQIGMSELGTSSSRTSGASLVKLGGVLMVGVAGIFVCFL